MSSALRVLQVEAPAVRPLVADVHQLTELVAPGEPELLLESVVVATPHQLEERLRVHDLQKSLLAGGALNAGVPGVIQLRDYGIGPAVSVAALQLSEDERPEPLADRLKAPVNPVPVTERHDPTPFESLPDRSGYNAGRNVAIFPTARDGLLLLLPIGRVLIQVPSS